MMPGEVCEVLRISTSTLQRWAAAGMINVIKTLGGEVRGGHHRVLKAEVERVWRVMHEHA